ESHAYPSQEGLWVFFHDISERKRQQQELEATTTALETAVTIANARTALAEKLSREREEGARWLNFLAEAEYAFGATLDNRAIADALVHIAVPVLADAAGVMELGKDSSITPDALAISSRSHTARTKVYL